MDKQKIITILEDLVYEDINNEDYWKAVKEARVLIKELKQALTTPAVVGRSKQLPERLCKNNPNFVCNCIDQDSCPNFPPY